MGLRTLRRRLRVRLEDAAYRRRARARGLVYDPARIGARVRPDAARRLAEALDKGGLRIFAAVRHHNW